MSSAVRSFLAEPAAPDPPARVWRDWVLLAESAFWVGTALGVWALAQGIIAMVKGRGRGLAIAAVAIAVIGPIAFFVVLQVFLAAGYAAGSSVGG